MTFHSIVRMWCKMYRPMLDSPKNRRFFLTDSTAGVVELAKKSNLLQSPCVVMESDVDGAGPLEKISRNYPVYFFVKAEKMADGDAAALAKEEAWQHAQNFLAWLRDKHMEEINTKTNGDFAMINLEGDVFVQTAGPMEDGWWAVLIQFERLEPLNKCIDPCLYVTPCDCQSDSSQSSE